LLDVSQPLPHARELSALETKKVGVIEGLMPWKCFGIVEAIHHQKVDPLISPVFRRWKWALILTAHSLGSIEDGLKVWCEKRIWHGYLRADGGLASR